MFGRYTDSRRASTASGAREQTLADVSLERTASAFEAIVDYAETKDVDFIAMGTHGRDGSERYVVGSVAERVVNTTPMPVLTVRVIDDTLIYLYESILVPTDGSEHATTALRMGTAVTERYGATLHLLAVLEDQLLGLLGGESDRESQAMALLEDGEATANDAGVDEVVTAVESESVPTEITSYVNVAGIDLMVMGSHGRTGLDERFPCSMSK